MPEIGTSGLMRGDGKRGDGQKAQATAPILDSPFSDLAPMTSREMMRTVNLIQLGIAGDLKLKGLAGIFLARRAARRAGGPAIIVGSFDVEVAADHLIHHLPHG